MRLHSNQLIHDSALQRLASAVDGFEGELRPHRDRVGLEARSKRQEQHPTIYSELTPFRDENGLRVRSNVAASGSFQNRPHRERRPFCALAFRGGSHNGLPTASRCAAKIINALRVRALA